MLSVGHYRTISKYIMQKKREDKARTARATALSGRVTAAPAARARARSDPLRRCGLLNSPASRPAWL